MDSIARSAPVRTKQSVERNPVRHRVPITQEYLATAVAGKIKGISEESKVDLWNELYDSIRGLVFKLAQQFSITCKDDAEDLAHECMKRIIDKVDTYDPDKAKFTTWVWRVCQSILSRHYRQTVTVGNQFIPMEDMKNKAVYEAPPCGGMLGIEMTEAVRDLAKEYPEHTNLVHCLFGNPDSEGYCLPGKLRITEAAQMAGVEYSRAYSFYRKVVRPFFKSRFGEHDE